MMQHPRLPSGRQRRLAAALLLGLAVAQAHADTGSADAESSSSRQLEFNIPAQPLDRAVLQLAQQAGIQVFFDSDRFKDLHSSQVHGRLSIRQALDAMLANTPVSYRFTTDRQVRLERWNNGGDGLPLQPVRVSGAPVDSNEWVYQEPRSVNVITRADLDRRSAQHAADLLVETPGVSSAVNRHNPGLSVNIRGMQDFGRVNMMIDGMRQNHVESGHQQRNGEMYVDSELLANVVIDKGPNAGVHGANAIAGSANFRTLDFDDIILPGQDHGVRLRGSTGLGGYDNGVKFIGSAAVAGRLSDELELMVVRSRKNLGEYKPGQRGRPGTPAAAIEEMLFSDQTQDSWLAKARLHIADDHALQFTYVDTGIGYNNVSTSAYTSDSYTRYGKAQADNQSYALDYSFTPDNPLVDLHAKFYFVRTENDRVNNPGPNQTADTYWQYNLCKGDNLDAFAQKTCLAGMRGLTATRTDTLGFQLENTSRFELPALPNAGLVANYGLEWFQDEGKSSNRVDRNGVSTPFLNDLVGSNLNPNGRRDVASAFSSLTFINEPFTVKAGLRYDWYRLRGTTTVPGAKSEYRSRLETFTEFQCSKEGSASWSWREEGCLLGLAGDEQAVREWYNNRGGDYDTSTNLDVAPGWVDQRYRYPYDVDRHQGKLSPFLAAAYRPLDWLELFANWGRGFRPPSMTETLWEGSHGGGSNSAMYPNPLLNSERTTSWEVGANVFKQQLFTGDDRFMAKAAYFDTRATDYMFASINNTLPGVSPGLGLGNTFFQNNLVKTRFRGVELSAHYDARRWYSGVNYTRYLGSQNDFCTKTFPVGSHSDRWDKPNEDGSMTPEHLQALAEGYSSFREKMDAMSYCGADVVLNSVVARPMDKHIVNAGIRLLQETVDIGVRYQRAEGYAPKHNLAGRELWDSYTTWDLYALYQPTPNLQLNLSLENLRDKRYLSEFSDMFSRTYAPGRTVQAGVEVRF